MHEGKVKTDFFKNWDIKCSQVSLTLSKPRGKNQW
jgi:hypothetical protein